MILKRTGVIQQTSQLNDEADDKGAKDSGATWSILRPGTLLQERYEVVSILGQGGMSTVYRGRDRRFTGVERIVAIKEMFNVSSDNATRQMRLATFEREANLLATLQHSAIPKIHDYFTLEGRIYLILEFIDGRNLETVLEVRKEVPNEAEVVSWGTQVCDLLAYLHGHRPDPIIFRDLKPSNIMLRSDGRQIVLVDFGIARTFQGVQRGTMIGTEGYAPPEQYRGLASPAGDIYALGATLHHLSTGNDPRLETPFTFHHRPPRKLNALLSEAFEAVVLKAVAYNPAHRFASAEELRQSLVASQIQVEAAPAVVPPPAAKEAATPPPRQPTQPARSGRPKRTTTTTMPAARRATAPTRGTGNHSTNLSLDGTNRVIWSLKTGDEVRGSGTVREGHLYIGSYDGNLYAVTQADGHIAWRASGGRGICSTPAVTDTLVIYGSEDQSIYAVQRATGRKAWSYRTGLPVRSSPRVSGNHVYVGSDDSYIYCLDLRGGTLTWRTRTWSHVRSSPFVTSSMVAVGSDDGYLYAVDHESGSVLWRFQSSGPVISSPYQANGLLLFGSLDGAVYAVRSDSGERVWRLATGQPVLASVSAADGVAYVGSVNGTMYAINVEDGEVIWEHTDDSQITSTAATDATFVYYGSGDGYLRCLNRADGELIWQFRTSGPVPSSPLIDQGTLYVGSADFHIYALRLDDPGQVNPVDEAAESE